MSGGWHTPALDFVKIAFLSSWLKCGPRYENFRSLRAEMSANEKQILSSYSSIGFPRVFYLHFLHFNTRNCTFYSNGLVIFCNLSQHIQASIMSVFSASLQQLTSSRLASTYTERRVTHKNVRHVGLSLDVWRNDVKGGSEGHSTLSIQLCVESGEKKTDVETDGDSQQDLPYPWPCLKVRFEIVGTKKVFLFIPCCF